MKIWSWLEVVKYHTYFYGRRFTIVTEHLPLMNILNPNSVIHTMHYIWLLILMTLDTETQTPMDSDDCLFQCRTMKIQLKYFILQYAWISYQWQAHKLRSKLKEMPFYHMLWIGIQRTVCFNCWWRSISNIFRWISCPVNCLMWQNRVTNQEKKKKKEKNKDRF